ncbi:DUF4389 domain-containing protein [Streptomyces fragilis]|uniref:DUF4389 domain-containing protein n=1 Tax=Streptomyces fragilis TaxID=67301 RepID=A0ABV2YGM0_9ACTN|nr:DUF4389 domain-containing protein [Streptomyces fragilis]
MDSRTPAAPTAAVRVEAGLDERLSRWLWLVKWLLLVPHYVVLAFLWIAFLVVSVIAFFAILCTARYPRPLFEFNAGVLRWSWRVHYYSAGAFATDRYPPFSLGEEPDYPARLHIARPGRLSRGLVLVKWWLLTIPHYVVVGFLAGGGYGGGGDEHGDGSGGGPWMWSAGLITVLAFFAIIAKACTDRYPRGLFDLIVGFNRWVLRVAAYAALMTDAYPPFRLDQGGAERDAGQDGPRER